MENNSEYEYNYHFYPEADNSYYNNLTFGFKVAPHLTACIRHYTFYIITGFGCISNVIILIVLLNSGRMRSSVSGVFLIAVAVSDISVLVTEQMNALMVEPEFHGRGYTEYVSCPSKHEILFTGSALCSATAYFKYTFRCLSTLLIVGISAHRFIIMKFPLTFRKVSNLKIAISQIAVMGVVSFLANIYAIHFVSTSSGCVPDDVDVYSVGVTVVMVVLCDILGSLVIVVLSLCTVRIYISAGKHVLQRRDTCTSARRKALERQMTVLLVAVALTFVLMRLPYTITWLPIWFRGVGHESSLHYVNNITKCIYLAKNAINLYLYCICSHRFREEFRLLMGLKTRHRSQSSSGYRMRGGSVSSTTVSHVVRSTTV